MEKKKSILLVDDDQNFLTILESVLKSEYKTTSTKNGKAALKAVQSEKPDLVILDIAMPQMDGYEVCQRMKADDSTKDIPVIFVTALEEESNETKGFELGAADYINKPFSHSILLARVKTHLDIRAMLEEQKSQTKKVEKLNEALKELDALRRKFLGVAAHDLWNPLLSIRSMSQTMTMSDMDAKGRNRFFEAIYKLSNRMLKVVSDLLDISTIEQSVFDILFSKGNVSHVVSKRMEIAELIAKKQGVKLVTELAETPESTFDKRRIGQAIDNLISNAIKYSEPGEVVTVSTRADGDNLEINISDQGPGLPEDLSAMLEEKRPEEKYRLAEDDRRSAGFGLYIAMQVVHAHGGQIKVESKAGVSATFTIVLPMNPPT